MWCQGSNPGLLHGKHELWPGPLYSRSLPPWDVFLDTTVGGFIWKTKWRYFFLREKWPDIETEARGYQRINALDGGRGNPVVHIWYSETQAGRGGLKGRAKWSVCWKVAEDMLLALAPTQIPMSVSGPIFRAKAGEWWPKNLLPGIVSTDVLDTSA